MNVVALTALGLFAHILQVRGNLSRRAHGPLQTLPCLLDVEEGFHCAAARNFFEDTDNEQKQAVYVNTFISGSHFMLLWLWRPLYVGSHPAGRGQARDRLNGHFLKSIAAIQASRAESALHCSALRMP